MFKIDFVNLQNNFVYVKMGIGSFRVYFFQIEHDMDFIGRLCDPVIVMAEGSVLFEGSVEDAKKDEKVIESYLGRGSKLKNN